MQKIKIIIQAYFFLLLHNLGLLDEEYSIIVEKRKKECNTCPLRNGKWCSKNRAIVKYNLENINRHLVNGCGCYLPAKYFTQDLATTPCPLNKWK